MKIHICITFLFLFNFISPEFLFSQETDQSQTYINIYKTIENINRLLGSDCKLWFNKELIVTFYEKGVPMREDRAYLDALDPHNVHYSAEEKSVIIQCLEFKGMKGKWRKKYSNECIGRQMAKQKRIWAYSRITFPVADEKKAELQTELENLIKLGHEMTFK